MIGAAAWAYAALCLLLVGFQLALVAGAPWGHLTQGGLHRGALPVQARMLAALSAVLLAAMALAILMAAGAVDPLWPRVTGWAALAVTVLTAIANWATPSAPERRLWGPVTTVMLALSAYVMLAT